MIYGALKQRIDYNEKHIEASEGFCEKVLTARAFKSLFYQQKDTT